MEKVIYGFYPSMLGEMVLGKTDKGLCWLGFMVAGYKGDGLERLRAHFKGAEFVHDDEAVGALGDAVMQAWEQGREDEIALDLHGSAFQRAVWAALLKIRKGQKLSYGDVANDIGRPLAARAVGSAVGENPVSLIVPCHRVVQKSGALGNYGWGVALKRQILDLER
ncbi:MAG: methylated-DNA--[protein]-cysteine S-methyltransferase [Rhodospirillales bacterium]|nr:methylated-DNA--[protein]-cysteine S-methyltransferase [Rhodospirillales bacterium]